MTNINLPRHPHDSTNELPQPTAKLLEELSKGIESILTEGVLTIEEAFSGLED